MKDNESWSYVKMGKWGGWLSFKHSFLFSTKSILLKIASGFRNKNKGEKYLFSTVIASEAALIYLVGFLTYMLLWQWQEVETCFLVFTKTWSLAKNMKIYKWCGQWFILLQLVLQKPATTLEETRGLHIGDFVLGKLESMSPFLFKELVLAESFCFPLLWMKVFDELDGQALLVSFPGLIWVAIFPLMEMGNAEENIYIYIYILFKLCCKYRQLSKDYNVL